MKTWVALLRGINIGGHHLIRMADLRHIFTGLGCQDVRTYIQSGNLVFKTDGIDAASVSSAIEGKCGFQPDVVLLEEEQFLKVAQDNPFQDKPGKLVHVFFFHSSPGRVDHQRLEACRIPSEEYHLSDKALYLHAPDGVARSRLAASLHRCFRTPTTARNLNTINKLLRMLQDP